MTHTLEIPYVYGQTALTSPNPAVRLLSEAMADYWISFAVSLTPNDGKGLNSTCSPCAQLRISGLTNVSSETTWPQYQSGQQVLLQFDTGSFAPNTTFANLAVIPDDYRSQQIGFINSIAGDLGE